MVNRKARGSLRAARVGRKEIYRIVADLYGDGVSAVTPNSALYPADPLLDITIGHNWYAGNDKAGRGRYGVKEAYAEVNVPILDSDIASAFR